MTAKPTFPTVEVRHDDDEVTFAVTFKWDRPWAMDHCEVIHLGRQVREALEDALTGDVSMVRELVAVETWEPNEEVHVGARVRNINLKPGEPVPT